MVTKTLYNKYNYLLGSSHITVTLTQPSKAFMRSLFVMPLGRLPTYNVAEGVLLPLAIDT